jgi:hypothetical protein
MNLRVYADGNAIGIEIGENIQESPAGFGPTLAAALRNLAEEVEKYGCDLRPAEMADPAKALELIRQRQKEALDRIHGSEEHAA